MQPTPPATNSGISQNDGHHYVIAVTGCQLDEKQLKDWLRLSAPKVFFIQKGRNHFVPFLENNIISYAINSNSVILTRF